MAENANFFIKENNECLPNSVIFGKIELLKISNNLDDDEISLFITVFCILTRPTGSLNIARLVKNILRFCTLNRPIRFIYLHLAIRMNLSGLFQTIDDPSTLGYYPISKAVLGNGILEIQLSDILR